MKKRRLIGYKDVLETYASLHHGAKALQQYNKWFPLCSSTALAGIIADLMSDGHVQSEKLRIDYTAKEKSELERFNDEISSVFRRPWQNEE